MSDPATYPPTYRRVLQLAGFVEGPVDVGVLSLRQRRTDPAWLGRVLAVSMSFNLSGLPIGSAIGGLVVAHSAETAFAIAATASVLAAAAACALVPAHYSGEHAGAKS